jgi:KDO2-lipid IV(A) lauroyltransferase
MSAHFGNFEIMPKAITNKFNINMAVVMREMKNKDMNEFFKNIRANEKVTLLYKHSAKEIVKLLNQKVPVGILIDQNYNRTKTQVKFFYEKTFFNDAISKLARRTNAYVLPVFCYLENDKYIIEFKNPKQYFGDIQEFTQWQASLIEEMIKKYPDQYFWFHKRWKRTHKY